MSKTKLTQKELEHIIGAVSSYALRTHGKRQEEARELLEKVTLMHEIERLKRLK